MKQSIVSLFTLLVCVTLLGACSQEDTITIENPPADSAAAEDADSDAIANSADEGDSDEDADSEETDAETSEDDDESDTAGLDQKNVKLEVSNQQSYGQIKVAKVATSRDGWVSVHRSKEDGSIVLPEGIGEARVDSGDSENVIVDLWEATEVGEKIWVLLHIDADERGKYEYPGNDAPVRRNGELMARSLVIQGEEEEDEDESEESSDSNS